MRNTILLFALVLAPAFGQISGPSILYTPTDPSGACNNGSPNWQNYVTGVQSACVSGTWAVVAMSGGGSMVYPAAGVANSTGSGWGTSLAAASANTASALVQRDASGDFSARNITSVSTVSTEPRNFISQQFSADTFGARHGFMKARGTPSSPSTIVTGDNMGRINAWGYDGTQFLNMGSIIFGSEGTIGTNRVPTYLSFSTATDAAPSVWTEAGRITSGQRWILGNTSTTAGGKLDIQLGTLTTIPLSALNITGTWNDAGTTHTGIKAVFTTTAAAAASTLLDLWAGATPASVFSVLKSGQIVGPAGIKIARGTSLNWYSGATIIGSIISGATNDLFFYSGTNATPGLTLDNSASQNFGVGLGGAFATGAPSSKLTVAGGSTTVYDSATLGSELATSDATATGWTAPAGWACATGVCTHTASGGTGALTFTTAHNATDVLKMTATVVRTAGTLTPTVCGTAVTAIAASASPVTYDAIQCTSTGALTFTPTNDFAGSVNVQTLSLKRIMGGTGTYKGQLNAQPGGTVPAWKLYRVTKTTNGTRGCATANGCWEVNGVSPVAAAAGLTQDIVLVALPANWQVTDWSIKSGVACTGATTALTGLGDTESNVFFRAATYDIAAAPGVTNLTTGPTAGAGANTSAATNLLASVVTTIANVDQLVAGCSFDVHVLHGVKPQ